MNENLSRFGTNQAVLTVTLTIVGVVLTIIALLAAVSWLAWCY